MTKLNFQVTGIEAEYSSCGSHRLALIVNFYDDDDVAHFIAEIIPQLVQLGFGPNLKDHLGRHYESTEEFLERIRDHANDND